MYTVVDIETTGLSAGYHQITEIAAVRLRRGEVVESFETLVNPGVRIPSFITKLTGIDNVMVRDAPSIREVLPLFSDFVGKDVFVAHNATFDYGFLDHNMKKHGHSFTVPRLCTKKLANRLFPDLERKRLSDLCLHLGVENSRAHRAMADVRATAAVFRQMLGILHTRGVSEVEDVLKFEKSARRVI